MCQGTLGQPPPPQEPSDLDLRGPPKSPPSQRCIKGSIPYDLSGFVATPYTDSRVMLCCCFPVGNDVEVSRYHIGTVHFLSILD